MSLWRVKKQICDYSLANQMHLEQKILLLICARISDLPSNISAMILTNKNTYAPVSETIADLDGQRDVKKNIMK